MTVANDIPEAHDLKPSRKLQPSRDQQPSDNIIGCRFGMLVVQYEIEPTKDSRGYTNRRFRCLCDCGNEINVRYQTLTRTKKLSCGCTRFPKAPPADLTGQKFRKLTVISEAEPYVAPSGKTIRRWNCVCECGKTTTVLQSNLVSIHGTISCGCEIARPNWRKGKSRDLTGNRYGKLV